MILNEGALIKKLKESDIQKNNIKKKIGKLVESNIENIRDTQKKLQFLSKNHNKYNNRLKAYSSNK